VDGIPQSCEIEKSGPFLAACFEPKLRPSRRRFSSLYVAETSSAEATTTGDVEAAARFVITGSRWVVEAAP
jgi:hypothetical protein